MPTLPFQQFPFGGGFHGNGQNNAGTQFGTQSFSPVLDSQDCINLYAEPEGTPDAQMALVGTPGYKLFGTFGTGPIRAMYAGNGILFVLSGNTLYSLVPNGGGEILGSIGSSSGPCQILANGNDLIVVDSKAGEISCFPGGPNNVQANVFAGFFAEYFDTFYVALSSTTTNQINVSNSLSGQSGQWNALNFAVRTGVPDFLTGVTAINGQLWLLGQKNTEVWYDAGNAVFPFQRIQGATINVGCMARFSIVKMDNTIYWLGADDRGWPVVYRANGLQPQRISTPAVESYLFIAGLVAETGPTPSSVFAFAYAEAGHNFYVLNIPGYPSVVYDSTTGLWHRRGHWTGSAWAAPLVQTYASLPTTAGGLTNFMGSTTNGNVYWQSLLFPADADGSAIVRVRTCPHLCNSNRWVKYRRFELDADIINASNAQPSTGSVTLDYSNDGGRSFENGTSSYTLSPSGASGQGTFQKYYQNNLGRSRKRVFRVTYSSNTDQVRFAGAYVDAIPGTET